MDKHIAAIAEDNAIVHFREPDRAARKSLHEDMRHYPKYTLRAKYEPVGRDIRCGNCRTWTSSENARNACCGDDYSGCTSTSLRVICSGCHQGEDEIGYVYYNADDDWDEVDDIGTRKFRSGVWRATGQMIVMLTGTPYKHLNSSASSYRKRPSTCSIRN